MKIIRDLTHFKPDFQPISLTIGSFDGVHLGHQFLLNQVTELAKKKHGESIVVTFENHPRAFLAKNHQSIYTLSHKLHLLEEMEVDNIVLFKFNEEFKEQSAEKFLRLLHESIPFSNLILGHDSKLGKDRQGTEEIVNAMSKNLGFDINYLEPLEVNNQAISSTLIRSFIQNGDLTSVEKLLGRKYSIRNQVIKGTAQGKQLGFPTANLDVSELALPPFGVYAVLVQFDNRLEKAVANLGFAPTMRQDNIPVLEIHLLESQEDLYGKDLNVIFYDYLRAEKRFSTIQELQAQIARDVQDANQILKIIN